MMAASALSPLASSTTKSVASPLLKPETDLNHSTDMSLAQTPSVEASSCQPLIFDSFDSPASKPHPTHTTTNGETTAHQNIDIDLPHLFLACGICNEYFKDEPKLLSCLHTFCESCLKSTMLTGSLSLSCPTCKVQSMIPQNGISGLQTNFYAVNLKRILHQNQYCTNCDVGSTTPASYCCTECSKVLCSTCSKSHVMIISENQETGESKLHNAVALCRLAISEVMKTNEGGSPKPLLDTDNISIEISQNPNQLICPSHDNEKLSLYCTTCETAICEVCAERVHFEHISEPMATAISKERVAMQDMADAVDAQVPLIRNTIDQVNKVKESLSQNLNETQTKIEECFSHVIQSLNERRAKMLEEAAAVSKQKQKVLQKQRDALEGKLARMLSCYEFTLYTLEHGNDSEILLLHKQLAETMDELSSLDVNFTPEENDYLNFAEGDLLKLKHKLSKSGCIVSNSGVAHQTIATGEGLKQCVIAKVSVVTVTTKNHHGDLVTSGNAQFETYLQTVSGRRVIPEVCDNQNGTYELGYLVNEPGNYVFIIKLYGHHIKGSPFKVRALSVASDPDKSSAKSSPIKSAVRQRAVRRPLSANFSDQRKSNPVEDDLIFKVGTKGRNKAEFANPQGLCTTPNGRILIADSNNQTVQVFTNSGDFKLKFGVRGRQPGQLQRPTGVALTLHSNFLVSDYENKWISIHGPDGRYLNRIGVGKLLAPKGIAVDTNGHVIVVDNKACAVFVFQSNGKLLLRFGSRGNGENQFAGPHFVAINGRNDIIVSDFHNHCVKVFDANGAFLFAFWSQGEGNGQFNAPTGVAVDANGNIIVADWGNSRIQVFDGAGSFLSFVNTEGDPLYGPQDLAITTDGHIVVADSGNHCFKVYRYLQ
jgi:tripartite motif-containing protein 2/3